MGRSRGATRQIDQIGVASASRGKDWKSYYGVMLKMLHLLIS